MRNTLYNYAPDNNALVLALTQRAGRPVVERVAAISARSSDPAAERLREIIEAAPEAFTDQIPQLMFRPGTGLPAAYAEVPTLTIEEFDSLTSTPHAHLDQRHTTVRESLLIQSRARKP